MTIHFKIKYDEPLQSAPGIRITFSKGEDGFELCCLVGDTGFWEAAFNPAEHSLNEKFKYTVTANTKLNGRGLQIKSKINLKKYSCNRLEIIHEDADAPHVKAGFIKIIAGKKKNIPAAKTAKNPTLIFKAAMPQLQEGKYVCLTGSAKEMHEWNDKKPLLFKIKNNIGSISIDLSQETFPIKYKLGIYDSQEKKIIEYEQGNNRPLSGDNIRNTLQIIHLPVLFPQYLWKGAGINVPVSALRSRNSWGTGDFTDIKLLADWAADAGLKMIQLLPVNDTTNSYTDRDGYPYSPMSSRALHPQFLNVHEIAKKISHNFSVGQITEGERLEDLSFVDQPAVMQLKITAIKELFEKEKDHFQKKKKWIRFFKNNREWLLPYAAFCYLRDSLNDISKSSWGKYKVYDAEEIEQLCSAESEAYPQVLFWYYVQYRLHLQLKNASKHAHKKGIVLKADLPIGMDRCSVDTWMHPQFFDMNMQAGAPPDAFTPKGQNWSFPTYNWDNMEADNFTWFKKRLQHPQKYFDALRIDHVLGLFRIWSIPVDQAEGMPGKFVPMIPVSATGLTGAGIDFDERRFCDPYTDVEVLLQKFGSDAKAVRELFFEADRLKKEFCSQRNIAAYIDDNNLNAEWKEPLFAIATDVIFFKDIITDDAYHFRMDMQDTHSFKALPEREQKILKEMYHKYFFVKQNELWEGAGVKKLAMMKRSTKMLLCAEDLGMVPEFTEEVLRSLQILSLEVQQMGKLVNTEFSDISKIKYEAVVMPGTHDMATIREWWEARRDRAQYFFNHILNEKGSAPYFCEPWICQRIIKMHLQSPAMWSVFLMQDLLAMNGSLRRANPYDERINDPAFDRYVWKYRMHLPIETLHASLEFTAQVEKTIKENGR